MKASEKHCILETKDLSIGYLQNKGRKVIQKNTNLRLFEGEFVTILGKNGIGKSTLIRTLTKVQKPLTGVLFLKGKNLQEYTSNELSTSMSLVLTDRLAESQLTVFELVALGRQPYTNWVGKLEANDLKKIRWALEQTETANLANHHFYELSDGQLQRVLIARALAQDTEMIVLDEPTVHLDMHHTLKIFQLLKNLSKKTGKTILLATHEVNLAIQLADQLILLTDAGVISGKKELLIAKNAFKTLFPSELITFNTSVGQFIASKKF